MHASVVNGYGETEFTYRPHLWRQATSPATAVQVRQLMTGVTLVPVTRKAVCPK